MDRAAPAQAGPGAPPVTGPRAQHAPRLGRPGAAARLSWLPLLLVLAFQATFSLRLLGADTAFGDEATYLWAGHLEWAHLLHGAAVPALPPYFSGAPVIYPPLGALADSAGGLAGARLLSLAFMLGCTVLVWDVTRRLFGPRAAFFAAALFAALGPTQHLGAFATYDAMSLFLLALATWLATGAGERGEATGRMAAAGAALALANATAYATVLFDPVVIIVTVLLAWPAGRRVAARRALTLLVVTAAAIIAGLLAGGRSYLTGITETTLERAPGSDPSLTVLLHAWSWTGILLVLALCAVFTGWASGQDRRRTWLLAVLAAAALLGPIEQALLHTTDSLNKHVGLGAWFAAIAAGYAADAFIAAGRAGRRRRAGHRRMRPGPGFPRLLRRHPVPGVRHQLAQLRQLHRHLPPAGRSRRRPPARRGSRPGPLLPGRGGPVAALVLHPQHRPARRCLHRRTPGRRGGSRRPGRVRPVHQPGLFLLRRA